MYSKILKPEYVFVLFGLLAGLLFIFLVPPFQSPDEPVQFGKAVAISEGQLLSQKIDNISGNYIPASIDKFETVYRDICFDLSKKISIKQINESKKIKLNESDKVFTNLKTHAMYSLVAFLPQSIGVFVSKIFTDSIYWIMICDKLSLLLFYLIFGYYSIKSFPFAKNLALLLLLMPMSLFLASSGSADGVLIAVSTFFIAKIFQYSFQEKILSKKQYWILLVCSIVLALVKQSFLITLFILLIPKSKWGNNDWIKCLIILTIGFIISFICGKYAYSIYVPMNNANIELQLQFILAHPLTYIHTFLSTIFYYFDVHLFSFICALGWMNVILFPYPYIYYLYILLFLISIFFDENKSFKNCCFSNFDITLIPIIYSLNFVAIVTIIYLHWVQVYSVGHLLFLQGRYFIPIALPAFLFLYCLNTKVFKAILFKYLTLLNVLFLIFVYICVFFTVYVRYYVVF